jgi:hypothetical protein
MPMPKVTGRALEPGLERGPEVGAGDEVLAGAVEGVLEEAP